MSILASWGLALPALLLLALTVWVIATLHRNVGLVDIFWSMFFLVAVVVFVVRATPVGPRAWLVMALVGTWSLRLAGYLAVRNWNAPEDRRYAAIRTRNSPGFVWKSLYLVFGLQALLAWVIAAPLAAAVGSTAPLAPLDAIGATITAFGIGFEGIADAQLARFKTDATNTGRVLDRGLWRYTRHPNYFGECCVWWGLYMIALGAGGWWTIFSPLLMTYLLLEFSGVALLERDIDQRRPAYRDYVRRTNAFLPGPRRTH